MGLSMRLGIMEAKTILPFAKNALISSPCLYVKSIVKIDYLCLVC
jgi:hypothetical protein